MIEDPIPHGFAGPALPPATATRRRRDQPASAARRIARQTADSIEANPLAVVAGGLAIGAILGAAIPRSQAERKALAPVGQRIRAVATGAVGAAKSAGLAELDALGLTRQAARAEAGRILGGILRALVTAAAAAAEEARRERERKG